MQHKVHATKPGRVLHQFPALEGLLLQPALLLPVQIRVVLDQVIMRSQQKTTCSTSGITNGVLWFGNNCINNCLDQRPWGKILTCTGLCVLNILFKQTFVGIPFYVGAHHRPVFLVNEINNQPAELGRVLKLVLRFTKDQPE